ncbi:hypothetical protein [Salirhabdus sp. Marseille-P4669]|uniref:hypothetical protein n=1 Tax=Salirhabdus sp. Marseille-P4669 TaxID=2042310 RepID=UPI00190E90AD|nr:hypothetical protein [Salirhabdus sp. Marseille-P4669]
MNKILRNEMFIGAINGGVLMVEVLSNLMNMQFSAYVALAFLLYAIRRATKISKRYLPVIAVLLGVGLAALEEMAFNFEVMMTGIKYALYAVVIVFGGKFAQTEYTNRRNRRIQENIVNLEKQPEQQNSMEQAEMNTNNPNETTNKNAETSNGNVGPNVNHRY